LTTTTSRTVYSSTAYAPSGEQYATSGTADASFTGQNSDTNSGLYDFTFREYSPSQGRWVSPDPAGVAAVNPTNPQSWNRYAYVMNSPLGAVDPSGKSELTYGTPSSGVGEDGTPSSGGGGDGGLTSDSWKYDASYAGVPPTQPEIGPICSQTGFCLAPDTPATDGTNRTVDNPAGDVVAEDQWSVKQWDKAVNTITTITYFGKSSFPALLAPYESVKIGFDGSFYEEETGSWSSFYSAMGMTDFTSDPAESAPELTEAYVISQIAGYKTQQKVQKSCAAAEQNITLFEKANPGSAPPPSLLSKLQNCWNVH
jgi:RHS repeat-associated protein